MGGAALTSNIHHLILYEPSFGLTYPTGGIAPIEAAVAAEDPRPGTQDQGAGLGRQDRIISCYGSGTTR